MQPYPFLKANLKALERERAPIYSWLSEQIQSIDPSQNRIIKNRWGLVDWRMPSGQGLFDAITPQTAYRNWIPEESEADTSVTMIIGSNLGYGLYHLLSNTPAGHRVMVIEPRAEMLLACLGHTDYRPFLKAKRLEFIPPDSEMLRSIRPQLIMPCAFGKIFLRADLPSLQLGPEYDQWREIALGELEGLKVELYTVRMRLDTQVGNELKNFQRAMKEGSLKGLKGKAKGLGAVILGAGPSLEQFAPGLKENPGTALYATALQTLPALERYGLKPHFCMAIECHDALLGVYERLNRTWAADIPLIYSTTVSPEVIKRYPGPTIPMWVVGGIASHVMKDRELVLDVGGNVGPALLGFMNWCGADYILMAGQDFSWKGDATHARGHLASKTRFEYNPKVHIRTKDRNGNTIYTDPSYMTGFREMERVVRQTKVPVYNLYGGGMEISGSANVTWDDIEGEKLLEAGRADPEQFVQVLSGPSVPRKWPVSEFHNSNWMGILGEARKGLEKLFQIGLGDQKKIHTTLGRILILVQQDPLCRPYLMNEIMDFSGILYRKKRFGLKELKKCRQIMKKIMIKVNEVERQLIPLPQG